MVPLSIVRQGQGLTKSRSQTLPPREVDFSTEEWTVCLDNLPKAFAYFSDTFDEFCFISGVSLLMVSFAIVTLIDGWT